MEQFDNQPKMGMGAAFDQKRSVTEIPPLPVSPEGKPIIELSNSGVNTFKSCPRRYQLTKRFASPDFAWDQTLPTAGGSAIHEYLQAKAQGYSDTDADLAFFYAFDFDAEVQATPENRRNRGFEACLYTAKYAAAQLDFSKEELARIKVGDELRNAVEAKFNLILDHPSFKNCYHYRGAIDLVRYRAFGNRFSVADFKTHRTYKDAGDTNREHVYKFDDQLIPYGLVIDQLAGNQVQTFETTYYSIFIDLAEPVIKEYSFTRSREDVNAWLERMMLIISQIEQISNNEVWPRSGNGCEFYGNCCKYYKLCHIEDHDVLQSELLGNHDPEPHKPYPAWVTVNLELS